MKTICTLAALAIMPLWATAQSTTPPVALVNSTVVVVGSFDPVSMGESARSVDVIEAQPLHLIEPTVEDLLRADPSVALQQRGGGGTQADISLRGTTFEQTLVLLDGFRINDVETSHFNLDVPVPLDALGSIDVLHGAGSTLYGSDAIGGVIDVLTYKPTRTTLRLRAGFSSFGGQQQALLASWAGNRASEVLAGSHDASEGFMPDRDYSSRQGSSETRVNSPLGETDILLAVSDRPFGANQFYGNYDSFERTKGWFAGAHQQLGPQTTFSAAYRRHTDEFLLFRESNPPFPYENNHIDENWEATLRRENRLAKNLRVFYGIEENTDQIQSNSLGNHGRNNGAGYAQLELRLPNRGTLSIGAREQVFSGGQSVFSPAVSASCWFPHNVKLRASAGHGFRLPTFLDLYYSDPTHVGNPSLVPEKAWNFDGGADWYSGTKSNASVTFFYDRLHDTIDYDRPVTAPPTQQYMAENLESLRYMGVEASLTRSLQHNQQIVLAYTGIYASQPSLNGYVSLYSSNYAVHNASFEWTETTRRYDLLLHTRVAMEQHVGYTAYPVWDVGIARQRGWVRPYLEMANLSNTGYAEIYLPAVVAMPPRSFSGGVELDLHRHKD